MAKTVDSVRNFLNTAMEGWRAEESLDEVRLEEAKPGSHGYQAAVRQLVSRNRRFEVLSVWKRDMICAMCRLLGVEVVREGVSGACESL